MQEIRSDNTIVGYADPAFDAVAIVPADSGTLAGPPRALYVGVGGDVRVRTRAGTDVTFFNVPAGSILPIEFIRVWNTGTTASQMVGLI